MADVIWQGAAAEVPQIDDQGFGGSPASADVYTITADGQSVSVVVGTTATTSQICTEIFNALTGEDLGAGYVKNFETLPLAFSDLNFTDSGAGTLTVTGTPGKPFEFSISSDGSGTVIETSIQTATGSRFASNVDNWIGSGPTTGDTAVFLNGNVDCSYGLEVLDDVNIDRRTAYQGRLGLPTRDVLTGKYYVEAEQSITFSTDTDITIGNGSGTQSLTMSRFDFGGNGGNVTVYQTGGRLESDVPPVEIKNLTDGVVVIEKGEVHLLNCTNCTITAAGNPTVYLTGTISAIVNDKGFITSAGNVTTASSRGGALYLEADCTTLTAANSMVRVKGTLGTGTLSDSTAEIEGAATLLKVQGGKKVQLEGGGTIATLQGTGGTIEKTGAGALTNVSLEGKCHLDYSKAVVNQTITNPVELIGSEAKFSDPNRRVTNLVIDYKGAEEKQTRRGYWNRVTYGTPS